MQKRYAENSEVYREKIILGTANNANVREWELGPRGRRAAAKR